jgi:predicted DNA-binding transcriptional regulator AlpA
MDISQADASALRVLPPEITADRAGISKRSLERYVREGRAPTPVRIGKGRIGFYEHEVQAWLANLPRTREVA